MTSPADIGPEGVPDLEARIAREVEARLGARLDERFAALESSVAALSAAVATGRGPASGTERRTSLLVLSGDFDRLFAAFTVALGSLAMGMEVSIFFTFWGLSAIKKTTTLGGKTVGEKMVAMMLPGGIDDVPTSRLNMGGIGPRFFQHLMKERNVESLRSMRDLTVEMGARIVACETSMSVMGLTRDELLDGIDYGGVATYLDDATGAQITLFI